MTPAFQGVAFYVLALVVGWAAAAALLRARGMSARFGRTAWMFALAGALVVELDPRPSLVEAAAVAVLVASVVTCAATDLCSGHVLDVTTFSTGALLFALASMDGGFVAALVGCACGGGVLAMLHVVTRGRGVGLGDVKLAAAAGAWLGGVGACAALGVAFVAGAAVGLVGLAARRARFGEAIPFAPFIALGTLACIALRVPRG